MTIIPPPTDRIDRLRAHALTVLETGAGRSPEPELLAARAWMAHAGEPWTLMRRAHETAAILHGMTPVIDEGELLVGKPCARALTESERKELGRYREYSAPARLPATGQRAHMAIDYDTLLRLGVDGLRRQIAVYRARLDVARPADMEKDAFYRACTIVLDALVDCAHRYAERAEQLAAALAAQGIDEQRETELLGIAARCRRVPEFPARDFREALQAVHFVTFCLCASQQMLLFQLGRPDRYLLPFYRRDLAAGRITPDEALEWIDCLALMLSEYTPRGLAVGWMVGGRDASGADVCNELTTLCLQSIAHTRLSYPGIGLCWTPETPPEVMALAAELLAEGYSHPALFNDDVIAAGMVQAGLPPAEACLYQHSTCVEITPIASSNVYVASPYINLVQLLHDLMGVPPLGLPDKDPGGEQRLAPATFDSLLADYRAHLAGAIRQAVIDQNTHQATRRYNGGFPLLSCFVHDCLAHGADIDHGGARHNWIEPNFVGLSNLADSLAAIRQVVYQEETLTLAELARALEADFDGREDLRLRLLHRAPKYGNDDPTVDALATEIADFIRDEVRRYATYLGGPFLSGFFCWIKHVDLGRVTAASADGRRAGFPLAAGSGPAQGRERLGPTAAVLSSTVWDHAPHLGGIAVNLKFSRPRDASAFQERLLDVVETYLRRGGFEIQVNVVDKETLLAAREHPEQYRDLVVRIGGYSDYFVGLSEEMQQEIILRTEHAL